MKLPQSVVDSILVLHEFFNYNCNSGFGEVKFRDGRVEIELMDYVEEDEDKYTITQKDFNLYYNDNDEICLDNG